MLALSPPLLSTNMGHYWPLEDAISYEHQNYFNSDINVSDSSAEAFVFLDHISVSPLSNNQHLQAKFGCIGTEITSTTLRSSSNLSSEVKKLNHNASERDRRKKINDIYTSLRAILPASDHTKKLSIPATVSHATKYIPELQKQVEGLIRKKEEVMSRINMKQQGNRQVKQEPKDDRAKGVSRTALSSASASQLSNKEVSIQISTHKIEKMWLSQILQYLEKDGLSVITASSFESFGERLFHNLHVQSEGSWAGEYGTLSDKLMSLSSDNHDLLFL